MRNLSGGQYWRMHARQGHAARAQLDCQHMGLLHHDQHLAGKHEVGHLAHQHLPQQLPTCASGVHSRKGKSGLVSWVGAGKCSI